MISRMPFGMQFEQVEKLTMSAPIEYDADSGISWISTDTGRWLLLEWEWAMYSSTSTRNNDEKVERPPTTTVTRSIETAD